MLFFKTLITFFKDDEYRDLMITTLIIIFSGTFIYMYLEDWSFVDALYFSIVTLTTIGYGDYSPQTDSGKLFTILYIFIGIGMILSFINTLHNHYTFMKYQEKKKKIKHFNKKKKK